MNSAYTIGAVALWQFIIFLQQATALIPQGVGMSVQRHQNTNVTEDSDALDLALLLYDIYKENQCDNVVDDDFKIGED